MADAGSDPIGVVVEIARGPRANDDREEGIVDVCTVGLPLGENADHLKVPLGGER